MIIAANTISLQYSRSDDEKEAVAHTLRDCLNKG